MKPLINFKQLYFLLFILAAYGIIALMRTSNEPEKVLPANWYRSPAPVWTERSLCQLNCLGISDSNAALVVQYGQVVSLSGHSVVLSGRTFSNEELRMHLSYIDNNSLVDSIQLGANPNPCPCPR